MATFRDKNSGVIFTIADSDVGKLADSSTFELVTPKKRPTRKSTKVNKPEETKEETND